MLNRLPELIEPLLLADRNARFEGNLPLSSLNRIIDLLSDDIGNVEVNLDFGRKGRLATIEGHISAALHLKCQRCLESLEWPVNSDVKLGIISSMAQINNLPEGYEPLLVAADEKILLKNLIEDELLLGLPDIPKHENNCVAPDISQNKSEPFTESTQAKNKNPFSILADLKKLETNHGSTKK
jgi:uncharacterized protein